MTEKTIILPPPPNGAPHDAAYRLTVMVPKRRYLSYLRERWWIVLTCVTVAVGAVLAYETLREPRFNAYAQLYLMEGVRLNVATLFSEDSQTFFGTEIELLKGSRLRRAALDKLGLISPNNKPPEFDLEVVRPLATSILQLRATGSEAAQTQSFLQTLIDEYLDFKKQTRQTTTADLITSLSEQLGKQEEALKAEQEKWVAFQKTNSLAVLQEESKSAGLYLAELNMELAKLKLTERLLVEGVPPASEVAPDSTNVVGTAQKGATNAATAMASDTSLRTARFELALAQVEREKLVARYNSETHPSVRAQTDVVERLTKAVAILEGQNLDQQQLELRETRKRIAAIEAALPDCKERTLELNGRLSESVRLRNDLERLQSRYDGLLGMLQNVDLSKSVQQERVSLLEPPSPGQPELRSLPLRIALAGVGGLALSLGLVFAWHLLDDRFSSVRDIRDQFGDVVLGLLPQVKVPRARPQAAMLEAQDARHAYLEAYRHLRSALLLSNWGKDRPQILLVSAATAGEGRATVAVNLARVLAWSGLRVALVDADLRGGRLHGLLGGESNLGLNDYLRGDAPVQAVVQSTQTPGLSFITRGGGGTKSDGLLLHSRLNELLAELRSKNDFVLLVGAPILAADDAALLVPHTDAVVLVARPFATRARLLRQSLEMLYQRQAKQTVVVLNRARPDDLAGYWVQHGLAPSSNGKAQAAGG